MPTKQNAIVAACTKIYQFIAQNYGEYGIKIFFSRITNRTN